MSVTISPVSTVALILERLNLPIVDATLSSLAFSILLFGFLRYRIAGD
jgi:hypothetical protein